ncbi:MAG TPA: hypothetical protein VFL80_03745 [Thermoanaerobaculia bacterium]|nr:hypothetical protein [Thermoanaerobaculia bacterium]
MWPLRLALARLRPFNAATTLKILIVAVVFVAFLYGDFALFRRLFRAVAQVEAASPFFALALLRNLLAMVFLVSTVVLFSSAMTASIGAFFGDLDLDIYHSAPRTKMRIAFARWAKTLVQSAAVVFLFLAPVFVAFGRQYGIPGRFYPVAAVSLLLLLTIPVSLAAALILLLVRFFPVRRVHQIVVTLAITVMATAVIAFRMSRPERFFREVSTDDLMEVLRQIELPSMDVYPGTAVADLMMRWAGAESRSLLPPLSLLIEAAAGFVLFLAVARATYFKAFVRARESMAPVALGSAFAMRLLDRATRQMSLEGRALISKDLRILARDVAQWSQLFLMAAILVIYLYNIRMLPLAGDVRAVVIAYVNVAMAGFVIAAICLRFVFPAVSSEGKAFWLVQSAPVSYRRFLWVKVIVFAVPLTTVALLLTVVANWMLDAPPSVWWSTMIASMVMTVVLVCLGVGLGAAMPNFGAENPLQVGLSLGGFAYMALAMLYVGTLMILLARPIMRYVLWRLMGLDHALATALPLAASVLLSALLIALPIMLGERSLRRIGSE